jgi:hypothetical protein
MVKLKLGMDNNGNKIVSISRKGYRGFSIQTNDNLPLTHRLLSLATLEEFYMALDEVRAYVTVYGTEYQCKMVKH